MAGNGSAIRRAIGSVLLSVTLAACAVSVTGTGSAPLHPTALSACADSLGPGWDVAVEQDRGESSTLAFVSGDSIATCQTSSRPDGTDFGNTATGVGRYPMTSVAALSYLTGGGTGDRTAYLVGRIPRSTTAVHVAFADGSEETAVLGGGLWLVWLDEPIGAKPIAIQAVDASGTVLSRLADPGGIQPSD